MAIITSAAVTREDAQNMTGPDDKFLLKMGALLVVGSIALVVAWLLDKRKAAKNQNVGEQTGDKPKDE